jgi:methylated-DNA-[protein]-cysteine S-methyltransferase
MISAGSSAWMGSVGGTPLGEIWAAMSIQGLVAVEFPSSLDGFTMRLNRMGFDPVEYDPSAVRLVMDQIEAYLGGWLRTFDLPIDWSVVTPFQRLTLQATVAIPYGQTTTYSEIANRINRPRAARAVGRAQATNPMPLVIPCHRVLGVDGRLHGYGAGEGLATKAWLLGLEAGNTG